MGKAFLVIGLVVFTFAVVPIIVFPAEKITAPEIRYYIALFLLMQVVGMFGILRLYNSIIVNSGLLGRMIKTLTQVGSQISGLGAHLIRLKSELISSKAGTKGFSEAVKKLEGSIDKLAEIIKNTFRRK